MVRVVRVFCTFASILLLAAVPARAQLATAELNGRVTDESGAVLPGATVSVTQTATGLVRTQLRADRHRPAGRRDADDQCDARARCARRVGHGRSGRAAGRRPQRRHQQRGGAGADRGAAAPGPAGHGPPRDLGCRGADGGGQQPRLPRRREHLRGRRAADRRRLHARRRHAQQPAAERQSPAAVPRRAAGIPHRHQRPLGAERCSFRRGGERDHEVRHQPLLGQPVRVPPRSPVQRHQPVCGQGPRRPAAGRRAQAQPVRRHARRADHQGQAVLLRRLPGDGAPPASLVEHRVRADRVDAGRRLHRLRVSSLQWRTSGDTPRAVRQQPREPISVQPRGAEHRKAASVDDRSLRTRELRRQGRPRRASAAGEDRLPAELEARGRTTC